MVLSTLRDPDNILFDEKTGYFIAVKKINDKLLIVAFLLIKVKINMRVEYDPEADILYIRVRDEKVKDTVDLNEDVWVDLDENGEIVGIEIWQARKNVISEILKYLEKAKKIEV